jgi:2-polyprenyl-3-methyl-5-hydroxy-6-metoxy-1,4-benzoquinol methylase
MDRATWLAQRRRAVREQYDAEAPTYRTEGGDYPTPKHPAFIDRLLEATPPDGVVLDAACGAGKWFGAVREAGRRVVGTDQSAGMVEQALTTGLAERVEHIGLQELAFEAEFDAAMVIDAMENVAPEDWPVVAGNLARAVKPGGGLFVTLEEQEDEAIDATFRARRRWSARGPRRGHRGRRGGLPLLPRSRPGSRLVDRCRLHSARRGLRRPRGLGLPAPPSSPNLGR